MALYTRAISEQRLGKHVPRATCRRAKIEVLLETGCFYEYVVRAEKLQGRELMRPSRFCTGVEPGGRGIAIVEAVTRKRLVIH
jgi:hypothetical protein